MEALALLFISLGVIFSGAVVEAAECESGWTPYRDEQCIKIFTNLLTYEEASDFCASQGNEVSKSSLVLVKEADMQDLLANYTHETYDYLWLGGQYDEAEAQYKWEDGEPFTYTNWQEGYPRNSTDSPCVELRPVNARGATMADGKWADVNCQKRNLVMCQRALSWTLQDAIAEIIKIRKELVDAQNERHVLREDIDTNLVPVGSIYIEYYNQPSPRTLWASRTWEDISSTYAGLFFRASGGGSASWGSTQNECIPRISRVEYYQIPGVYPSSISIPTSGISEYIKAGRNAIEAPGSHPDEGLRFTVEECEIHPKNQAIRVWKRIA